MRKHLRHVVVLALAVGLVVTLPAPAGAAISVRALWNMDSLPTMVDSAGGDNNGSTRNVTLSGGAYQFNGTSSSPRPRTSRTSTPVPPPSA